jgi:hypothetical protein
MIIAWIIAETAGIVDVVLGFFSRGGLFMWPLLDMFDRVSYDHDFAWARVAKENCDAGWDRIGNRTDDAGRKSRTAVTSRLS